MICIPELVDRHPQAIYFGQRSWIIHEIIALIYLQTIVGRHCQNCLGGMLPVSLEIFQVLYFSVDC